MDVRNTKLARILQRKHTAIKANVDNVTATLKSTSQSMDELKPYSEMGLDQLKDKLRNNEISPLDLLHAFQAKSLELYREGHSGICEFIKEAEAQAQELTSSWDPNWERAPLYGIPISIKEVCEVKGYDATFGLIKRCEMPVEDDCTYVKVLKREGAIPFVLTGCSQGAVSMSGKNAIFGDMYNPHSPDYKPGGSSTGECVLLSRHGSVVGIGSDTAGSIRLPAAFCGLAGLKPCSRRLSMRGHSIIDTTMLVAVSACLGPIARKVDYVAQAMQTLLRPSMFELDPTLPVMPFDMDMYNGTIKSQLTIGYYINFNDDRLVKTVPAVRNAITRALNVLKQKGYKLIEFNPPSPFHAILLSLGCISADGGKAILEAFKHEPLNDECQAVQALSRLPESLYKLTGTIIKHKFGEPAAIPLAIRRSHNAIDIINLLNEVKDYQLEFGDAWRNAGNPDVVICPVSSYPVLKNDFPTWSTSAPLLHTVLYNLVDYPAGTVPTGRVSDEDVQMAMEEAEQFRKSGDRFHKRVFKLQQGTQNLPVGIQVVGRPFQEELVLRVMREIEQLL